MRCNRWTYREAQKAIPIPDVVDHLLSLKDCGCAHRLDNETPADFLERVRMWAEDQPDTNPVLAWTLGIRENMQRPPTVQMWVLDLVSVKEFYSRGVNLEVDELLQSTSVMGNVFQLLKDNPNCAEFRNSMWPASDPKRQVLIGVRRSLDGCIGTVGILDGVHRLAGAIKVGLPSVECYVAILK